MLGNRDSQRNKITTSASTSAYNRLDIEILSTIGLQIPNAEGLLEAENSWSRVPSGITRGFATRDARFGTCDQEFSASNAFGVVNFYNGWIFNVIERGLL